MGTVDQLESTYKKRQKPQQNSVLQQTKPFWKQSFTQQSTTPKTKTVAWEQHIEKVYGCKCFRCPGLYANELKTFVGFRGYQQKPSSTSHAQGIVNILDIHGEVFEGEARPEPRVPVSELNLDNLLRITGKTQEELGRLYYLGILEYEVEILTLKFTLKNMRYTTVIILMGRGLGKTWMEGWENGMRMKYFGMKVLLLSESDAGKDVGDWIYTWAYDNKLIKKTDRGSKGQTYLSFTLHNGAKLFVYEYMERHSLGKHEIQIVGDDIVNLDWQNRPSDEKRARRHWNSNLNHMNRIGFDVWGTRKYESDLLGYFIETLSDAIVIKISPYKQCPHQPQPNQNGVYEECHICKDLNLLAPELHSYSDYMDKKEESYDAYYSEQMQDPHRKEGGMLQPSDIHYVKRPFLSEELLVGGTGVDCSDTLDDRNDMVGIVSCLSERFIEKDSSRRQFTVYHSDVERRLARNVEVKEKKKYYDWIDREGKRIVRGIIESVQKECEIFHRLYPTKRYIVVWERNRSGIAFLEQALLEYRNRSKVEIDNGVWVELTWPRYLVSDKEEAIKWETDRTCNVKLGITTTGDKEKRIFGGLQFSIKEGQTCFTRDQELTVLMAQLLKYPKGHDDGPDALEMIKSYLNRLWKPKGTAKKPREIVQQERKMRDAAVKFKELEQPWLKDQKRLQNKHKTYRIRRTQ